MTVVLRPMRPDDAERLQRFHARLSAETINLRYHGPHPRLSPREIDYFVTADGHDHVASVACDSDGELLGVCRAIRSSHESSHAEVAIVVADDAQAHGIGRMLLDDLVRRARAAGIRTLDAFILASNHRALRLFESEAERLGLPRRRTCEYGVVELNLDLRVAAAPVGHRPQEPPCRAVA